MAPFPMLPGRPKPAKALSGNDLCALCFLLIIHLFLVIRLGYRKRNILSPENEKIAINRRKLGGLREDEIAIAIELFAFLPLRGKNSVISAYSAVDYLFLFFPRAQRLL
jgi:hypothetical protein